MHAPDAGATTLNVQSSHGFVIDRPLILNRDGQTQEYVYLAGFGSLVLKASPTACAHMR